MAKPGLPVIQQEWKQMNDHMSRLKEERDQALAQRNEARKWCGTMLGIILLMAMALGYALAQGIV